MKNINIEKLGYTIGVIGVAITLLWIGLFKFTLFEAKAIEPLVANHFGMNCYIPFYQCKEYQT